MTLSTAFTIVPETEKNKSAIQALHEDVFGPGRFSRTAFRVREGCPADARFSFVALSDDILVGSVRLTAVGFGKEKAKAFLLGPLCVVRSLHNMGIGKALVDHALSMVLEKTHLPVILVGDASYYAPLGFERAPSSIKMPGPVDMSRLLIAWPAGCDQTAYYGTIMGLSPLAIPHGCKGTEQ